MCQYLTILCRLHAKETREGYSVIVILGCKEVYIKVNNYLLLRIKMSHKIYGEEATWNKWASRVRLMYQTCTNVIVISI